VTGPQDAAGERAAQSCIGEHAQRARQRIQQLRGMDDAIEVARHGLERIVRGNAAIVRIFELL